MTVNKMRMKVGVIVNKMRMKVNKMRMKVGAIMNKEEKALATRCQETIKLTILFTL